MRFDTEVYGVLLHNLRYKRGFRSARALADKMTEVGFEITPRIIYAIETGEQVNRLDRHMAMARLLAAPEGYFEEALVDDAPVGGE